MEFDYKLNYVPGAQIPHADALSRLHFDNKTPEEEETCFLNADIFFAKTQRKKLNNDKSNLKLNRKFWDGFKRRQSGDWIQFLVAESLEAEN